MATSQDGTAREAPGAMSGVQFRSMTALPPGTLLQLLYLRERLRQLPPGRFVEVGPGAGYMTALLLDLGWQGTVFELEPATARALQVTFQLDVREQRLTIVQGDYLRCPAEPSADLVISCMVIEHLDETARRAFVERAGRHLRPGGQMYGLVPASPRHWGVEDDIAGHMLRFTRDDLNDLMGASGWTVTHVAGLTYPLSNLLLPLSNLLVRRHEHGKLALSMDERTRKSGRRSVTFKTHFPPIVGWLLNPRALAPLHWLQKRFVHSERALVLYFEARPLSTTENGRTE